MPGQVLKRFYEVERNYMQSGQGGDANFNATQATLDPDVNGHGLIYKKNSDAALQPVLAWLNGIHER